MKTSTNFSAGLAGAVVLNLLHEAGRWFFAKAPRVDLIGEEAISKSLDPLGIDNPRKRKGNGFAVAGDLVTSSLYYSAVGAGKERNIVWRGAGYGLVAGVGAITFHQQLGLNEAVADKAIPAIALTLAGYLIGGLVTAFVAQRIGE